MESREEIKFYKTERPKINFSEAKTKLSDLKLERLKDTKDKVAAN